MTDSIPTEFETAVQTIARYLCAGATVAIAPRTDGSPLISIDTPQDANVLIGKNGQNLQALEHIIRMVWMRKYPNVRPPAVDVNGYQQMHMQDIATAAHTTAHRVQETKHAEVLDPMNSAERRVVHTELAAYHNLATESIGQEPHRRVVIKPL